MMQKSETAVSGLELVAQDLEGGRPRHPSSPAGVCAKCGLPGKDMRGRICGDCAFPNGVRKLADVLEKGQCKHKGHFPPSRSFKPSERQEPLVLRGQTMPHVPAPNEANHVAVDESTPLTEAQGRGYVHHLSHLFGIDAPQYKHVRYPDHLPFLGVHTTGPTAATSKIEINTHPSNQGASYATITHEFAHHLIHSRALASGDAKERESLRDSNQTHDQVFRDTMAEVASAAHKHAKMHERAMKKAADDDINWVFDIPAERCGTDNPDEIPGEESGIGERSLVTAYPGEPMGKGWRSYEHFIRRECDSGGPYMPKREHVTLNRCSQAHLDGAWGSYDPPAIRYGSHVEGSKHQINLPRDHGDAKANLKREYAANRHVTRDPASPTYGSGVPWTVTGHEAARPRSYQHVIQHEMGHALHHELQRRAGSRSLVDTPNGLEWHHADDHAAGILARHEAEWKRQNDERREKERGRPLGSPTQWHQPSQYGAQGFDNKEHFAENYMAFRRGHHDKISPEMHAIFTDLGVKPGQGTKRLAKLADVLEKVRPRSYLYHATAHKNVAAIREHGLVPGGSRRHGTAQHGLDHSFFAVDEDDAHSYGREECGGEGAYALLRVPRSKVRGHKSFGGWQRVTKHPVKPEHLEFQNESGEWRPLSEHKMPTCVKCGAPARYIGGHCEKCRDRILGKLADVLEKTKDARGAGSNKRSVSNPFNDPEQDNRRFHNPFGDEHPNDGNPAASIEEETSEEDADAVQQAGAKNMDGVIDDAIVGAKPKRVRKLADALEKKMPEGVKVNDRIRFTDHGGARAAHDLSHPYGHISYHVDGHRAIVDSINVHPEHRGKGASHMLYGAMKHHVLANHPDVTHIAHDCIINPRAAKAGERVLGRPERGYQATVYGEPNPKTGIPKARRVSYASTDVVPRGRDGTVAGKIGFIEAERPALRRRVVAKLADVLAKDACGRDDCDTDHRIGKAAGGGIRRKLGAYFQDKFAPDEHGPFAGRAFHGAFDDFRSQARQAFDPNAHEDKPETASAGDQNVAPPAIQRPKTAPPLPGNHHVAAMRAANTIIRHAGTLKHMEAPQGQEVVDRQQRLGQMREAAHAALTAAGGAMKHLGVPPTITPHASALSDHPFSDLAAHADLLRSHSFDAFHAHQEGRHQEAANRWALAHAEAGYLRHRLTNPEGLKPLPGLKPRPAKAMQTSTPGSQKGGLAEGDRTFFTEGSTYIGKLAEVLDKAMVRRLDSAGVDIKPKAPPPPAECPQHGSQALHVGGQWLCRSCRKPLTVTLKKLLEWLEIEKVGGDGLRAVCEAEPGCHDAPATTCEKCHAFLCRTHGKRHHCPSLKPRFAKLLDVIAPERDNRRVGGLI